MSIMKNRSRFTIVCATIISLTACVMASGLEDPVPANEKQGRGLAMPTLDPGSINGSLAVNPYKKSSGYSAAGITLLSSGITCALYGVVSFVVPALMMANSTGSNPKLGIYSAMTVFSVGIGTFQIFRGTRVLKYSQGQMKLADDWDRDHAKIAQVARQGM